MAGAITGYKDQEYVDQRTIIRCAQYSHQVCAVHLNCACPSQKQPSNDKPSHGIVLGAKGTVRGIVRGADSEAAGTLKVGPGGLTMCPEAVWSASRASGCRCHCQWLPWPARRLGDNVPSTSSSASSSTPTLRRLQRCTRKIHP